MTKAYVPTGSPKKERLSFVCQPRQKRFSYLLALFLGLLMSWQSGWASDGNKNAEQHEALQEVLNWIVANNKTPQHTEFNTRVGSIQINYERLTSTSFAYKNGIGIFPSTQDFWLSLYRFGQSRGVDIQLLDVVFYGDISPELKNITRKQALQRVLDWIKAHPQQALQWKNFRDRETEINVSYDRLTSASAYKNGKGIFQSNEDFWLELYRFGQSQGVAVQLVDVTFRKEISQVLKDVMQQQSLQRVLNWIQAHGGQIPHIKNFVDQEGQVQINYDRLTSTGPYKNGKGIFPSTGDFWLALYRFGQSQGVEIWLLNVKFHGDISQSLKDVLKQQSLQRVLNWMRAHPGQIPLELDFGGRKGQKDGQIHITYNRLTGTSARYAAGRGIFSSTKDFRRELYAFARSRGIQINLSAGVNMGESEDDSACDLSLSSNPND
jgi:hypothetical protein